MKPRALLPLVCAALLARATLAAEVRLELRVTSVAGAAVYVDRGESGGLRAGDRVEFRLASGVVATGVVRVVSAHGARVELDPASERPTAGARGAALVPDDRPRAEPLAWSGAEGDWPAGQPLLAPATRLAAEDRPARWRGRAWLRFDGTLDAAGERTYGLVALGTDATLENAFGSGGTLRADVEVYARQADVADDDGLHDYDQTRLRVDRLAYDSGERLDRAQRVQAGRFQQAGFPELGLLDGVEWSARTRNGTTFGASFGFMPEPFADRSSFDDLQAAVWARHVFGADARHALGLAYQNTWHAGRADRNLFLVEAASRPSERLALRATAWIDLYGPSDEIKDDGFELTEARVSATWTAPDGAGWNAFVAERRIPELLRDEFLARRAEDVAQHVLDRAGVGLWTRAGRDVRLDARLDGWRDEEDAGWSAEAGATLDGALGASSALTGAVSWADGTYSSGPGVRLQARRGFGAATLGLGWHSTWYEQKAFAGDDAFDQHAAFFSVDAPLSDALDLSIAVDRTFGDDVDGWSAGILWQARF